MSASNLAAVDGSAIEARAFSFSYPGADRAAVHGITFAVYRHEIFGFLGPSGAGKSTMRAFWSAAQHESYWVFLGIGCLAGTLALAVAVRLFERQLLRRA